eukprot:gene13128-12376_t
MKDALQLMVLLHLLFVVVPIFGNDGGYSLQYHGVLSGGLNIEVFGEVANPNVAKRFGHAKRRSAQLFLLKDTTLDACREECSQADACKA